MKPYNVSGIITLGEVNNPVMVWIFFFSFFFFQKRKSEASMKMFWDSD